MAKVIFGEIQLKALDPIPKIGPQPVVGHASVGLSEEVVRQIIDEAIKGVQPVTIEKPIVQSNNIDVEKINEQLVSFGGELTAVKEELSKKIVKPTLTIKEVMVDKTQDFRKELLDVEHNLKNLISALNEKTKEENRKNMEKLVKRVKIEMSICFLITLVGLFI